MAINFDGKKVNDRLLEQVEQVEQLFENEENYYKNRTSNPDGYSIGETEDALNKSIKTLREKYPMGGYKSSLFITSDILLKADPEYFDQYDENVKIGVNYVQTVITENSKSEIIGKAKSDPTNEEKQENAYKIIKGYTMDFVEKNVNSSYLGKKIVANLITSEIIGFSKIDPLWRDGRIDEILCNGPKDVQIEIKGQLEKVVSCKFRDKEHLEALIEKLYSAIGKKVSKTTPIVDGRLHDNSRMAVVHNSIAPDGPNFSIRRHKENYIPPQQIIDWGTSSKEMMAFLGNIVYKGCSVLMTGGTSSGKTTLMGALVGFIRPDHRILTLEDNLELKLPKTKLKAAAMECLPPAPDRPNSGIDMRDLVKASLRLRPDAIIVGETRDGSAYDLCQALNTGHYGMSSLHANGDYDAIYRLVSLVSQGGLMSGDGTLPLIAASFDLIVRVERFPSDGTRKIVSISEVAPRPEKKESGELWLPTYPLWKFVDEGLDKHNRVLGHWEQVGEISEMRREFRRLDLEKDLTWEELKKLSS